jgi:CO dehydrogenase maturation factor
MPKDRYIELRLQGAIAEADGFDLLTMGRPEGPGCYCYVNNTLRNMIGRLIDNYDYIVIDNEAGLEHLSRRTTGRIEAMVVVSGPTQAGLRSADRISALVDELALKVKHRFLIMNCASQDSVIIDKIKESKLDYLGSVAKDWAIEELSQRGGSLMELDGDSLSLSTLSRIGEKIWQQG